MLVYHGLNTSWELPDGKHAESFAALCEALQNHRVILSPQFPRGEDSKVIGIDLAQRRLDAKAASASPLFETIRPRIMFLCSA